MILVTARQRRGNRKVKNIYLILLLKRFHQEAVESGVEAYHRLSYDHRKFAEGRLTVLRGWVVRDRLRTPVDELLQLVKMLQKIRSITESQGLVRSDEQFSGKVINDHPLLVLF